MKKGFFVFALSALLLQFQGAGVASDTHEIPDQCQNPDAEEELELEDLKECLRSYKQAFQLLKPDEDGINYYEPQMRPTNKVSYEPQMRSNGYEPQMKPASYEPQMRPTNKVSYEPQMRPAGYEPQMYKK